MMIRVEHINTNNFALLKGPISTTINPINEWKFPEPNHRFMVVYTRCQRSSSGFHQQTIRVLHYYCPGQNNQKYNEEMSDKKVSRRVKVYHYSIRI